MKHHAQPHPYFVAPDPIVTDIVVDELVWQFNLKCDNKVRLMVLNFWNHGYTTADVEAAIRADCWTIGAAVRAGAVKKRP